MAIDLREMIATSKIATDLERMGDLAKNNAKRVTLACARRDLKLARTVSENDGEIDTPHTALFCDLLTYMMEDPRGIMTCRRHNDGRRAAGTFKRHVRRCGRADDDHDVSDLQLLFPEHVAAATHGADRVGLGVADKGFA
jgi:phosphate uptake regulator